MLAIVWYSVLMSAPPTCNEVVAFIDGAFTVPVKVGEAIGDNRFKALSVAVEIGLLASDVFETLPSPTIVAVIPVTVPVKVGDAKGAFRFSAACVAVDIGLSVSAVLLTLPSPTIVAVIPFTVPVNVGLAFRA